MIVEMHIFTKTSSNTWEAFILKKCVLSTNFNLIGSGNFITFLEKECSFQTTKPHEISFQLISIFPEVVTIKNRKILYINVNYSADVSFLQKDLLKE